MKALKLAGIFVLVLAVFIGIFFLTSNGDSGKLPPVAENLYETYRQQFTNDWEQAGDWNETLFKGNYDMVQQLSTQYGGDKIDALRQLNTRSAVELVKKKVFDEWASPTCRKAVVDKYVGAVNIVKKTDATAEQNDDVKKILSVNSTYSSAYSLAHKGIGLSPRFDGSGWQSYVSYAQSIKNQKAAILRNSNYTEYLSNITDIKNGLNAIDGKLQKGRASYYQSLAQSIISYYRNKEHTPDNLNSLRSVRNRYESEYQQNSSLTAFTRKFAQSVQ